MRVVCGIGFALYTVAMLEKVCDFDIQFDRLIRDKYYAHDVETIKMERILVAMRWCRNAKTNVCVLSSQTSRSSQGSISVLLPRSQALQSKDLSYLIHTIRYTAPQRATSSSALCVTSCLASTDRLQYFLQECEGLFQDVATLLHEKRVLQQNTPTAAVLSDLAGVKSSSGDNQGLERYGRA